MLRFAAPLLVLTVPLAVGCREPDAPVAPGEAGTLIVDSDPQGARLLVNGEETGQETPDTLRDLVAEEDTVEVLLDTLGLEYGFVIPVRAASPNEVITVRGPLLLRCASSSCVQGTVAYHEPNTVRFATSPLGALLYTSGAGGGLFWPGATTNSYVSGANAVIAGVRESTGDTVALGPYDYDYLVGRPVPEMELADGRYTFRQTSWILPSGGLGISTIRGIEIEQTIMGDAAVDDVVVVRLVFRNITGDPLYRTFDPGVPPSGETYESVYVGFTLDADIGNVSGEADDDRLSYDADRDLVFVYDGDFLADAFGGGWNARPGVVGVRVLEAPAGTTVALNAWPKSYDGVPVDWSAGMGSEPAGWRWLSARHQFLSNHPDERIGHAPGSAADYRVSVAAGGDGLRLAPGDTASLTVAVLIGEPVAGTFTSGTDLEPGDPTDTDRALYQVVAELLQRADEAEGVISTGGS